MTRPLRILHLEDDPLDANLIRSVLQREGIECIVTRVEDKAEFCAALEKETDLVLADFSVPGFNGLSALALLRKKSSDVPFILVSGTLGEERAIESLRSGATDYVLKTRLARLVPAVRRAMSEVEDRVAIRRAEAEREKYSRKLGRLSRRLVEVQENERRSIARELHDQVGQSLTIAQLNLQAMLQSPNPARVKETLSVIDDVLEEVRNLSLNLRPSLLDDLGLEPALHWYFSRQAALAKLEVAMELQPLKQRLDPVIETECFRIAQEAMTNIVRHAGAHLVKVQLGADERSLHLRVRDDGVGFEVAATRDEAVRGASLGLLSMEERAALAGGGLEFISHPGDGAEVHAWFPLKWRDG